MGQNQNVTTEGKKILPDEEIIELYWSRDERAISATDDKYRKFLLNVAYNIVYDDLDCEECLNDTYLGTWNRIPPTRPNVLRAFLSRIMRNVAVTRFRKKTADRRVPSELTVSLEELEDCMSTDPSVEDEVAICALSRALNKYLREMDEKDRLIFICRYYYADKIMEIADMMDISRNTVTKHLTRIREELREYLIKEGVWYE